jgi:uncharacterized repeat protein (TIGR03806 family)
MYAVLRRIFAGWSLLFMACQTLMGTPYGQDTRSAVGPFFNNVLPKTAPGPSGAWTTVSAFPNLTFQDPVFLIPEPGTNRLYVGGREGYIWFFANNPNTSSKTVFLDLHNNTQGWDDCGLLAMAFHPEYGHAGSPNRGYVYVYYQFQYTTNIQGSASTRPPFTTPSYNRLSRFTVPDGSLVADPNSEVILINQFDRHIWHNGGGMFFGPDGFLYLTNGDEGDADDSYNNTQRINGGLFSGVLRMDVNQDPSKSHPIRRHPVDGGPPPAGWPGSFSGNYYIPNDNPWVNPDGSVLEEFWAIGLRSPHRMTFDPVSGQMWLGDVGQASYEEVDLVQKAGNYQWAYMEGSHPGPKAKPATLLGIDSPPVYDYPHDQGNNCVICGYVYRGSQFATDLGGKLLFGDDVSGHIWTLVYNGPGVAPTVNLLCNMPPGANYAGGLSSFGLDQNKEIYMCAMGPNGQIFKLGRTGAGVPDPPARLSQVGVFTNMQTLSAAGSLVPYDVNMPLWSDSAVKQRWAIIPTNTQAAFSPTGEWTFPTGTVFVKHFDLPIDDTDPTQLKRLETRLLVRDTNGAVYGVTYKWRPDNSDADLLTNSLSEDIIIATSGGTRTQTWYYPSRQDCLTCHTPNANFVLGVKTRQLNGNFLYPSTGITDNQLRTWNHLGLLTPALVESNITNYAALVNVTNSSATLDNRVRSYLDANCAQCHRPNGVQALFDARYDTPLADQNIINGNVDNNLGIAGAKVIRPADIPRSIMDLRMNALGANQMPPLARNRIDGTAVATLEAWINSLPPVGNFPPPWADADVGNVGLAGSAGYSSGAFNITAGGNDIWDNADSFHFVYQQITGDGQIVAHLARLDQIDTWTKGGVMIRETLAPDARNAFMLVSSGNGTVLQGRSATGGASANIMGSNVTPPYWVKLVRSGNTFSGYDSSDGVSWHLVGTESITMASAVYVGMAVTAHNNSAQTTASFDNVQVNGVGTPIAPNITTQPQSQAVTAGSNVTFSVTATGTAPLQYQWRFNAANISGATASSYTRSNVQSGDAGNYSVVVSNSAGSVASSNAVLTVNASTGGQLPAPWVDLDIGAVGVAGSATFGSGVFTVMASGADIWNAADAFNYVYQPFNGDGQIVARVTRLDATDGWAKSGVMIRESLAANARNLMMLVSAANGTDLQTRAATGSTTTDTGGPYVTVPYWVKLVRAGNVFTGYDSVDGTNWVQRGSSTVALASAVYAGLAVTSHNNTTDTTSIFDNVQVNSAGVPTPPTITAQPQSQTVTAGSNVTFSVTATGTAPLQYQWQFNAANISGATAGSYTRTNVQSGDAGNYSVVVSNAGGSLTSSNAMLTVNAVQTGQLPPPWTNSDIGVVGFTGSAGYASGVFTVKGSGNDIWDVADGFQYVYQPMTGNGQIIARVTRLDRTDGWAKAGLMMRETLNANSRNVMMLVSDGNGTDFQRRLATGGTSTNTSGPFGTTAPYWLKLVRNGNVFTGYDSGDGTNWVQRGSDTIAMASGTYVGLAVTSHGNGTNTTAVFSNVQTGATNHPPVLSAITNRVAQSGSLVIVNASATDPDPGNQLTFSLGTGAPAGASINNTNGVFTWRPTDSQMGTNQVTIQVTDNGTPNLSDAKSFSISVLPRPMLRSIQVASGQVMLTWSAVPGQSYRVEYKTNLTDAAWTPMAGNVTASGSTATITDNPVGAPRRFYHIVLVP